MYVMDVKNAVGELPAIASYQNEEGNRLLDIAFAVHNDDNSLSSKTGQSVDASTDSIGPTFFDPTSGSMNSFDVFNEMLAVHTIDLGMKAKTSSTLH